MKLYVDNSMESYKLMDDLSKDPKFCAIYTIGTVGNRNIAIQTGNQLTFVELRNALLKMIHDTIQAVGNTDKELATLAKSVVCETLCNEGYWVEMKNKKPQKQYLN